MSRMKTIKTVLLTFAVALGTGFLVQSTDRPAADQSSGEFMPLTVPRAVTVVTGTHTQSLFGFNGDPQSPTDHTSDLRSGTEISAARLETPTPDLGILADTPVDGDPCRVTASAVTAPTAMIILTVSAPCLSTTAFDIMHAGLRFSASTDRYGAAQVVLPALTVDAKISVVFNNVERATLTVNVPDAAAYDRMILQWRGPNNLQLHVLEGDAKFGDQGHIWSGSVHTADFAVLGQHGYVLRRGGVFGDVPYLAEVYTLPLRVMAEEMSVKAQIGAIITPDNCNRSFDVELITSTAGIVRPPILQSINAPSCDAVSQFQMLPDALAY